MLDFARTALLMEEKAARLSRDSHERALLLAVARAARMIGFEQASWTFEMQGRIGSHRKRAYVLLAAAAKLQDGPDRQRVECMAWRASIHAALERW
jgi:hypothetical protein